jgi:acetyl esterase
MSIKITDTEVLEFIARTESFYPPDGYGLSVAENRRLYDEMCAAFRQPRPASVAVADRTIPGPGGPIPIRRYRTEASGPVTVIYMHGGGYLLGGLDSHDDICAEIADRTGCKVVSVDYRLCPEHAHPAQYDDCLAVARAVLHEGPVILAGDSAGGNTAAALAQTLKEQDIRGHVLIYPGLGGWKLELPSLSECADAPLLKADEMEYYGRMRAGGPPPEHDPTFAPLEAEDFLGLAPCFVSSAGVDPLRDDGVEYVRLLIGSGIEAYCVVEPQLPHGHLRARHMSHRARAAFERILDAIRDFAAAPAGA